MASVGDCTVNMEFSKDPIYIKMKGYIARKLIKEFQSKGLGLISDF